jgi:hypothetical protein
MEKIETNTVKPNLSITNEGVEYLILNIQEESLLDSKISDIENYMSSNVGKDKTDQEKDELYKEAQVLWYNFVNALKDAKYNFYLNRGEHKFLTDLILTKLEYDVNTIFFAIELTNTMGNMRDAKYINDTDVVAFPVNATEITYIYHLISKHKIKGLTKDAYTFSKLLLKIGDISKIFNYYETTSKNLSKDIQDWIVTFDKGVDFENVVDGKVLQPEA